MNVRHNEFRFYGNNGCYRKQAKQGNLLHRLNPHSLLTPFAPVPCAIRRSMDQRISRTFVTPYCGAASSGLPLSKLIFLFSQRLRVSAVNTAPQTTTHLLEFGTLCRI